MGTKRVIAGNASRQNAYKASTAFMEALAVVRHDLREMAEKYPNEVSEFFSWMRKRGRVTSRTQILRKIGEFDRAMAGSLRLYSGFVLRFHVYLKLRRPDGALDFEINFTGPRHSQLKAWVRGGALVHPPLEDDADYRDRFASAGGIPAQIRFGVKGKRSRILKSKQIKLADTELVKRGVPEEEVDYLRAVQRRRGSNPEDAKLRFVEVESADTSALTQLLDLAYDPLSITFLLVRSRRQTHLMCLVGELVTDHDWDQVGAVRAMAQKAMHGKTPAGAPFDFQQFAVDIDRLPPDGKISKKLVINAIGGEGSATPTEFKKTEKRLQRAKSRQDRVRRQLTL